MCLVVFRLRSTSVLPPPESPKRKSPLRSTNWGIRMDHPELETMDYTKEVEFFDSDDEDGTGFVEVSEQIRALLETKCTQCAK